MMRTMAFALALHLPLGGSFFGVDKVKHFLVSAFVHSVSYSTLRAVGTDRRAAQIGAAATTMIVGFGKELYDKRASKPFSIGDLLVDAAGSATAAAILNGTR